jgi:hypothetical protein
MSKSHRLLVITISIALIVSIAITSAAQTPTPQSKASLIKEIEDHAERHAKSGGGLQTEAILKAYGNNPVGLSDREVLMVYDTKFYEVQKKDKTDPWKQLGWAALLLMLGTASLTLFAQRFFGDAFTKFGETVWNWIYSHSAGNLFFRTYTLKRYRRALFTSYRKLPVAFRPNETLVLRDVYVPLRVLEQPTNLQLDAYQAIKERTRTVVTGAPGAGKSMLLKYILLSYSINSSQDWPDAPIPVLLELYRLNSSATSIDDHLAEEFRRNDFPNAQKFVAHNLKKGRLLLLLDGFDEVWGTERQRVALEINNFLKSHQNCRAIITSRKNVYNYEFKEIVAENFEIIEFNDYQIRKFLHLWNPRMTADQSPEQLIQTLHERPQIMALARNPLLLTMIAFLYTDELERYPLPHSRALFYYKSADLLLRQLKEKEYPNKFHSADKRLILEELAYTIYENTQQEPHNSRSIPYLTIINKVRELQTQLSMDPKQELGAIIKEIEERSGILITFDGGSNYEFAHRSFQEFFVAEKLKSKTEEMFSQFLSDPKAWHEPVKLWCGLPRNDSTSLILNIFEKDPNTALECLADAELVDQTLSETMINFFKTHVDEADSEDGRARALGVAASSPRPRGRELFQFLEDSLNNSLNSVNRRAVAKALSYTDLPQAARSLAHHYPEWEEVRGPLVRMGDLAVRELASLVRSDQQGVGYKIKEVRRRTETTPSEMEGAEVVDDSLELIAIKYFQPPKALEDLQTIGTPNAAEVFVDLLWDKDNILAGSSAWRLSALLSHPDVEDYLQDYKLPDEQLKDEKDGWVWKPFSNHSNTSLRVIAAQVANLINNAPFATAPVTPPTIDPRLAIPLCAVRASQELNLEKLEGKPTMGLAAALRQIFDNRTDSVEDVESHRYDLLAVKKTIAMALTKLSGSSKQSV